MKLGTEMSGSDAGRIGQGELRRAPRAQGGGRGGLGQGEERGHGHQIAQGENIPLNNLLTVISFQVNEPEFYCMVPTGTKYEQWICNADSFIANIQ